jgi:phage baseplate assembly protein W
MNEQLAGFAFPFRINVGIERARGGQKIKANLRHLLATRLGERVMLRGYGGGVQQHLQAAHDSTLRALVKHEIEEALRIFMPEIELVAPLRITNTEAVMTIEIEYRANPDSVVQGLKLELP